MTNETKKISILTTRNWQWKPLTWTPPKRRAQNGETK